MANGSWLEIDYINMSMEADESASIIDKDTIELKNMAEYGTRGEPDGAGPRSMELLSEPETESEGRSESEGEEEGKRRSKKKRETWDNKAQFILTLIGYAVGLGNVWRFSYLVAKNGGSAFLFPYIAMLFLVGIPLFYLELLLGQGTKKGPIGAWFALAPNLGGIGIASIVVTFYISLYYNVIMGWVIFYFVNSFHSSPLPWGKCYGYDASGNETEILMDAEQNNFTDTYALSQCLNHSTEFYWYENALRASDDIGHAETFNWPLLLTLLAAWVVVYLCIFRGIQSSGKVVYFTATFPYVVLICFFFRAVTLPGAGDGLRFLFLPDSSVVAKKLLSPKVWLEAATQIFFSLGLSLGALIALASYTKPHNNALKDSLIVCLTNSFTSIFSSIVVFSIVGFKARESGTPVELVSQGPGLAFEVFTEAINQMPLAPLWAVLFFIMLFLLGLDSQFAGLEAIITVLRDNKRIAKIRKEILVGILCSTMFLLSIPFVLGNGEYLFQLMDQFAGTLPLLLVGMFEFITVGWVFGVDRFFNEVVQMTPNRYMLRLWKLLWIYVNPIVMTIIFLGSVITFIVNPLEYSVWRDYDELQVEYPSWAQFVGTVVVLTSVLAIPVVLILRLIFFESAREEALDFLRTKVSQFEDAYHSAGRWCSSIPQRCREFHLHVRGSWSPQRNEEEEEDEMDTTHLGTNGTPHSNVSYGSDKDAGGSLEGSS